MGFLKNFESPRVRPRLLFRKFLWAFVPIDPMNVRTKFEVRSRAGRNQHPKMKKMYLLNDKNGIHSVERDNCPKSGIFTNNYWVG